VTGCSLHSAGAEQGPIANFRGDGVLMSVVELWNGLTFGTLKASWAWTGLVILSKAERLRSSRMRARLMQCRSIGCWISDTLGAVRAVLVTATCWGAAAGDSLNSTGVGGGRRRLHHHHGKLKEMPHVVCRTRLRFLLQHFLQQCYNWTFSSVTHPKLPVNWQLLSWWSIFHLMCTLKVHGCVHKCPSLDPTLS
jgi:hypothetical protein